MRRGRIQIIKVVIGAIIVLAVFYFLFSDSNVHSRAKHAISARFTGDKLKERPVFTKTGKTSHSYFRQINSHVWNKLNILNSYRTRKL